MAMFEPIPLPQGPSKVFKDVMDYYDQLQQWKLKKPLIEAQTQEAAANAQKAGMIAKLLQGAYGGDTSTSNLVSSEINNTNNIPTGLIPTDKPNGTNTQTTNENASEYDSQGRNVVGSQEDIDNAANGNKNQDNAAPASANAVSQQSNKAKETLQALGITKETPAEQEARTKRTQLQNTLDTSNIKKSDAIEADAVGLKDQINLLKHAKEILDKNPNITGPMVGRLFDSGLWNSKPLGEFNTVSGLLAAPMTRMFSDRGNMYAQKAATLLKPNKIYKTESNYGAIQANYDHAAEAYKDLQTQYKQITGKELPIKIDLSKKTSNESTKEEKPKKVHKVWKIVNGELV